LSVADNARNAVLLHVSAASERQKSGNKRDPVTSKTKGFILKFSHDNGYVLWLDY